VNGAANAVAKLGIQLGELVAGINASFGDIPHSCSLHNVPDDKLLDSFVLRDALSTVGATHRLHVAPSVLVTAVISALGCHSEVNCTYYNQNIIEYLLV